MGMVNVCFDLGKDTLKVTKCVKDRTLKFTPISDDIYNISPAIPAEGYYDVKNDNWIFGSQIDKGEEKPFDTVVKMKDLLNLLRKNIDTNIETSNNNYFFKDNQFPKFTILSHIEYDNPNDFDEKVRKGKTFTTETFITPCEVVKNFFRYVKSVVDSQVKEEYTISLIFPSKTGKNYVNKYLEIIQEVFGQEVYKSMSSTRALSFYAKELEKIRSDEPFLVFDIGDDTISVSKATMENVDGVDVLTIDGIENHNLPMNIGGSDIDKAIDSIVESDVASRATFSSSNEEQKHVVEKGMYSKKYLMLKSIKVAKELLSSKNANVLHEISDGVPLSISRELYIQKLFTLDEFKKTIGTDSRDNKGPADVILDYILEELARTENDDVTKVLIAGGTIETYGLFDYIKSNIKNEYPEVTVSDFSSTRDSNNNLFAACKGGNVVSVLDIDIRTRMPVSYGTYVLNSDTKNNVFSFISNKGDVITDSNNKLMSNPITLSSSIKVDEYYSLNLSKSDIEKEKDSVNLSYEIKAGKPCLNIGKPNLACHARDQAIKYADLKVILQTKILLLHNGREVQLLKNHDTQEKIQFKEGFLIRKDGVAEPIIENYSAQTKDGLEWVNFKYLDELLPADQQEVHRACKKDFEVKFENPANFEPMAND